MTYIIPSIKVCQHEYKLMNTEMKNKATFSQRIHRNDQGFFFPHKNKVFKSKNFNVNSWCGIMSCNLSPFLYRIVILNVAALFKV